MKRRDFINDLSAAGVLTGIFSASGSFAESLGLGMKPGGKKAPNILFVIDDQHNKRALGWTGQTKVKTPNLDRFSREAVRFSNCYTSNPVCAPARHSLYSGLYSSDHHVLHNERPMKDGVKTIISILNDAGYTTASIGKMHNAPFNLRRDFQYVLNHEFFTEPVGISHYFPWVKKELKKRGQSYRSWAQVPAGCNWLQQVETLGTSYWMDDDLTPETWMVDQAAMFMKYQKQNNLDQPFFMHLSLFPPHHPYCPTETFADLYDPDDIDLPPSLTQEALDKWCTEQKGGRPVHMTPDDVKYLRALYYGFVSQVDASVGKLFEQMKELGLWEDTIIVFTSDHGDMMGEQGRLYKDVMYDGSAGVPLLVKWPGIEPKTIQDNVSHLDLIPTLLSAAGAVIPKELPGSNMRNLMNGQELWPNHSVFSEFFDGGWPFAFLMHKKGAFKLIATNIKYSHTLDWDQVSYELYDLQADPYEMKNLHADPEFADQFNELRRELIAFWDRQSKKMPEKMPARILPDKPFEVTWPPEEWNPILSCR
jgi:choline-sulfatase